MFAALSRLMEAWGTDLTWGLSLYRRLRALSLVDVGMEGYVVVWESRSPGVFLMRANFEQVRQKAVNAGFITNGEVAQVLTLLDDPDFAISAHLMFTA
jgi:hypothetical protein